MTFKPVSLLTVFHEPEEGRRVRVGRLASKDHEILFEFDRSFLDRGLEISPFKLGLRPGVLTGDPAIFDGLMGVFEDSLPDGWGRLLMDRRAAKAGLRPAAFGPLDRLALVGSRGLGALVYEPEIALDVPTVVDLREVAEDTIQVLRDIEGPDLDRLIALGGSPQGARPKALVQVAADGTTIYGDPAHRPGCTAYIVKFRAQGDDVHAGTLEHAYMMMAGRAGLTVPRTTMLGRTRRHSGYFAIERFDRKGPRKLHLHSFAGLVHARHDHPVSTYRELLLTTRLLTRHEIAVREMFRRACFNVFAHNRDDHTRNHAFLMDERGRWTPSPAYDLTLSSGPGGEHAMLVGRAGAAPGIDDLLELARSVDLQRPRPILDEVREAIDQFAACADEAGLPGKVRQGVAKILGVPAGKAAATRRPPPVRRR